MQQRVKFYRSTSEHILDILLKRRQRNASKADEASAELWLPSAETKPKPRRSAARGFGGGQSGCAEAHVANAASSIATQLDNVLPFGKFNA